MAEELVPTAKWVRSLELTLSGLTETSGVSQIRLARPCELLGVAFDVTSISDEVGIADPTVADLFIRMEWANAGRLTITEQHTLVDGYSRVAPLDCRARERLRWLPERFDSEEINLEFRWIRFIGGLRTRRDAQIGITVFGRWL